MNLTCINAPSCLEISGLGTKQLIIKLFIIAIACLSLKPDKPHFNVLIFDHYGAAGYSKTIRVNQDSVICLTDCDTEGCKPKVLYARKLTDAESADYYKFLRKQKLKRINGIYEDPYISDGSQVEITITGDDIKDRDIILHNVTLAETDHIIKKTDELITEVEYKFYKKN